MAGLVGVLRQLGELAEFVAQVFHGLYDEVVIASARGHGLMLRVQQLEAELPLVENDSCQRDYLYVASNRGVDWHANPRADHGVVTRDDTPRFIMESIKQCHGPPKLFMLDKYDIGGEGACLKRYTDTSFFKTDSACSSMLQEGIEREKRPLRAMEIRPNLQNSEILIPPNEANNDSTLEADFSGEALDEVPTRRQRLKYQQLNGSVFRCFRSQMQNLNEKASSNEKPSSMNQLEVQISFTDLPDSNTEERDIVVDTSSSMDKGKEDQCAMVGKNRSISEQALLRSSDARSAGSSKGHNSEVDIYVDVLTTMDSEVETDSDHRNHGNCAFAQVESDKICSDTRTAVASRSSSFSKKDSLTPYSSDVGSVNEDNADHHQEDVTVFIPQTKPVAGEHERTSSLEELFAQEKLVSCEHERTKSLEELLTGDVKASGPDMRESATESSTSCTNGIVSNGTSDGTVDSIKKAKERPNIATISLKKTASKRSKYVGSMELLASKVGILPRKLSKKHDPFSHSLRNMAKELLELKYNGTQDTDLYDFEADGEGCDVKCPEMHHPPVEITEENVIPSDSPQNDVGSRECQPEELNQQSEHDVPPTDCPQDSVPAENGFQDTNIVYFAYIASSSSREEEGCASAATNEHPSTDMLDHTSENREEQIEEHPDREVTEDIHAEVVSEKASDIGEDLKEVSICEEQVNAKNVEECSESDEYAVGDESTEYVEEQVVSGGVISSPTSSKQSDDPCRVTPLTLTDAGDAIASKGVKNHIPEMDHITLLETITKTDLPQVVTESVITNEAAVPDYEQCYLHPETSFSQDIVLSSYEVVGQNEQLRLCDSSVVDHRQSLAVGELTNVHSRTR